MNGPDPHLDPPDAPDGNVGLNHEDAAAADSSVRSNVLQPMGLEPEDVPFTSPPWRQQRQPPQPYSINSDNGAVEWVASALSNEGILNGLERRWASVAVGDRVASGSAPAAAPTPTSTAPAPSATAEEGGKSNRKKMLGGKSNRKKMLLLVFAVAVATVLAQFFTNYDVSSSHDRTERFEAAEEWSRKAETPAVELRGQEKKKKSCVFALRPDGLGNRLEQIMRLVDLYNQTVTGIGITLIWQTGKYEGYNNASSLLRIEGVHFIESNNVEETLRTLNMARCTIVNDHVIMSHNAHQIKPAFGLHFTDSTGNEIHPVGIHMRKSDRIIKEHGRKSDYQTIDEFYDIVNFVSEAIMAKRPDHVFIASDNVREKVAMSKNLEAVNVSIIEPTIERPDGLNILPVFSDFFGLSLCSEVWMVSRFSSYAIMATRANGHDVPLYTYFNPEETNLYRYQVPDSRLMRNWTSYK